MPDTADHRADMYALGQQRLKAGNRGESKISVADVFHNDAMAFPKSATPWLGGCGPVHGSSPRTSSMTCRCWLRNCLTPGTPETSTAPGARSTTRPTPTACGSPPDNAQPQRRPARSRPPDLISARLNKDEFNRLEATWKVIGMPSRRQAIITAIREWLDRNENSERGVRDDP